MGKENQFRTVLSVSVSEQIRQNGPEDSSHMNKTVMADQKLTPTSNWVSRKDAILGVFFFLWLPKLEVCVERGQARRGKIRVLACFALQKSEKNLTTFLQAEYLRPNYAAGVDKGGERRGEEGEMWQFLSILAFLLLVFPYLRMSCRLKNTE